MNSHQESAFFPLWNMKVCGLAALLMLTSCDRLNIPSVHDTKFQSIEIITQEQVPQQDRYWDNRTVLGMPLVKVTFSSEDDLQQVSRTWSYGIDNSVSFCETPMIDPKRSFPGFPDVYDRVGTIFPSRPVSVATSKTRSGPGIYHIYFALREASNPHWHSSIKWFAYDLAKTSANVCFQVNGGDEDLHAGFRTNVIMIPRSAITSAIERFGGGA